MDEVDGMSGGDRGGVGAMNVLIKKTKVGSLCLLHWSIISKIWSSSQIPMILICNDSTTPKMKPLQPTAYAIKFRRPSAAEVRSRLMTIAYRYGLSSLVRLSRVLLSKYIVSCKCREGLKLDGQVLDTLIQSSQSDLRAVLNMLSTWRLSKSAMTFDEGKRL